MPETAVRTLGAVLYKGFELLDLYGPLEMFGSLDKEIRIVTEGATVLLDNVALTVR